MENVNSVKLSNLRDDLEAQKTFFEYKVERFNSIIEKELNAKLSGKVDGSIVVSIKMGSRSSGFLPMMKFVIGEHSISMDSIYNILNLGHSTNSCNIESLDKIILSGFLALEIKNSGKSFEKIKKYVDILVEISHKAKCIEDSINNEVTKLRNEHNNRKLEVLEEFIKEGSEFVVNGYSRIAGKKFRGRYEAEGVLIRIKEKEKRSYKIDVVGRKRTKRNEWDWQDKTYEYKLGVDSLIKLFRSDLVDGSNPIFERTLKIQCLMD